MRLVTSRSAALRRTRRPIPSPAPIPIPSTYATLVGPTSLIPGQKHPLPPPPPPSPFPAPSTIPKPPLNAAFPTPKAQTTRESPPPRIVRPSSLSPLDIYLLSWMRLLRPDGQPTLEKLLEQMRERDHRQLDVTLEYEPTPAPDRAIGGGGDASRQPVWMADRETLVRLASEVGASSGPIASSSRQQLAEDDGIVLLAHVFPSATGQGSPRIVTSHGIALRTSGTSRLVATCAHPLSHLSGRLASPSTPDTDRVLKSILNSTSSSARVTSASLIFTPSGSVHPVTAVASCISDSDILILEVGDRLGVGQGGVEGAEAGEWKSAPVNPYPPACGTKVRAHRFAGGEKEGEGKRRWDEAEIIEYKDEMGLAAQPGTYDALSTFTFTSPPSPGASGGPLIDPSHSVVGLIRGSRADYGDRHERGFAVVSEKLWEVFRLPGLKLASERRREEEMRLKRGGGGEASAGAKE